MSYYNPVLRFGENELVEKCANAGVDGFLVVDLPTKEAQQFRRVCTDFGLSFIPLITPSNSDECIRDLAHIADSFIYVVSRSGVTGTRKSLDPNLPHLLSRVQKYTSFPLAVGFGVCTHEHFKDVGAMASGVVIGSQFINIMRNAGASGAAQAVREYAAEVSGRSTDDVRRERPLSITNSSSSNNITNMETHELLLPTRFGQFGGMYVPEALYESMGELERAYVECKNDVTFWEEIRCLHSYMGRPTPLHFADRLTEKCGGAKIFLKREDMAHTGSHKINNVVGQALIARRLGKTRIVSETSTGQNGITVATVCAKLGGLECIVYMGSEDMRRQAFAVFQIRLLGGTVVPVTSGSGSLKDAVNEAMRDCVSNVGNTHYLVASTIGCHPFPTMVRDFQRVIGTETKKQTKLLTGRLPDAVVACVGGGSNAIGMFHPFIGNESVRLIGAEAAGKGIDTSRHAATLTAGTQGVLHGAKTILLQDTKGQMMETHSVAAGLSYPGVGPEHAWLKETSRGEYYGVTDAQALAGFRDLVELEGIIPALESAHAVYQATQVASTMTREQCVVVCISGRGDKDIKTVAEVMPEIGPQIGWDIRFEGGPASVLH
ncbi:hypothetical protein GGF43_000883 [Coemansia sp. RSA 2618]|nr:hypothetical protein GGF43_000883 [Coemansia sp. RSA 2618]